MRAHRGDTDETAGMKSGAGVMNGAGTLSCCSGMQAPWEGLTDIPAAMRCPGKIRPLHMEYLHM